MALAPGGTEADGGPIVDRGLELLRGRLNVPIAFFSEIRAGREILRAADVGPGERKPPVGASLPLEQTFCGPMLAGEIPPVVPDVLDHAQLAELPATKAVGVRAYVGAPIVLPDGEIYGALCCFAHEPRPDLHEQHSDLVALVADMVADAIHRQRVDSAAYAAQLEAQAAAGLMQSLAERDPYTAQHSEAIVELTVATGLRLGMAGDDIATLRMAALLHDVGKIGVADAVLSKRGPLDEAEWASIRLHPSIGARLVGSMPSLAHLAPIIEAEHERWDGTGYPNGLAGETIPLSARIILVCDAYDAMVTDRVYRAGRSPEAALDELRTGAGTQFDPAVVDAFERAVVATG